MTVVGAVIIPLTSVSNMEQGVNSVITSSCIFICVFGTFLCLHGNRTVLLLQNYDVDSHLHLRKRSSVFARSKWSSKENDRLPESVYGVSTMNPFEAVKSKNLLNRRQTCNEQVVHWTSVLRQTEALMLIQEDVRRTGAEDTFHVPVGKQDRQYDLN